MIELGLCYPAMILSRGLLLTFPESSNPGLTMITCAAMAQTTAVVCGAIYLFLFILLYDFLSVNDIYSVCRQVLAVHRTSEYVVCGVIRFAFRYVLNGGRYLRCVGIADN